MTETQIANLALSHLAIGKEIANIETETSAEARAIRRIQDVVRQMVLRDFSWPFATKIDALALVEEDPNDEWGFSYTYPTECLEFKRILSGIRTDSRDTRVPHRIIYGSTGRLILCDIVDAEAEFTIDVTNTSRFPSDFTMAYSLRLAAYGAPTLTAGDPFGLGARAYQLYLQEISRAQANAANEEQPDQDPDGEFIRARG